jgi:preprotein translocase subunit SecA
MAHFLSKLFGDSSSRFAKKVAPSVAKINAFETQMQTLSIDQLKEKTAEFKERLSKGQTVDDILPEAFALVREAAKRTLNQRHFDVQLMGGIALHEGNIAEMRTGEGKTLSATLPAYLNALEGKGVHLVTVNDYLAKRDMVWMGQIYTALGLTVGCITNQSGYVYDANYKNVQKDQERDAKGGFLIEEEYLRPVARKEAYNADITYGTNHEFGFDYLRDNMVYELSQQVQRGYHFAIVDEVDSILIDEARVPLIISGQAEDATEKYYQFSQVVAPLQRDQDYTVDEKMKAVNFTEEGQNNIVKSLGQDPWAENDIATTHQIEYALRAKALFLKDRDYVVKNGEIMIIDEFTGRMLPGRRWSAGLHQAVEAKERVKIQPESVTMATVTFQNFFRLYKKISGMTGTALTSAEELDKVYGLNVMPIPTHRTMQRKDFADKIYKTEEGKFKAVIKEIKQLHAKGQPVLVGTRSVERNEYLGKLLDIEGIPHTILNAKNHEQEGQIIAQAGKRGGVTIATNMAGRGVDIILGGNPALAQDALAVRDLGGLYVMGTERHDARRIDNQLRGRAGRQGDPGSSQFFVSLEDDLMRIFGGMDNIKSVMSAMNVADDEPIQSKMISGALESAQGKIEGFNFDARAHILEYDDVMNKHREIMYKKRREFLESADLKNTIIEILQKAGHTQEDYDKKETELGAGQMQQVSRFVVLRVIDTLWQDHLTNMEHLRESVRLRGYGGKDPLVEYKNEGRKLFGRMLDEVDATIADNILKAGVYVHQQPAVVEALNHSDTEVGRNDFCPCGSGKKWKKCGMLNTEEHQQLMAKK